MKNFKIVIAGLTLFLLERLVFARFPIFSFTPWLGFAFFLVGAAAAIDDISAIVAAAAFGLVADLTGDGAAGSAMFVFGVSATVVQFVAGGIFKNSFPITLLTVFVVGIFGEFLYYLINTGGFELSLLRLFISVMLPLSAINTLFALIMYPISKRVFSERRVV